MLWLHQGLQHSIAVDIRDHFKSMQLGLAQTLTVDNVRRRIFDTLTWFALRTCRLCSQVILCIQHTFRVSTLPIQYCFSSNSASGERVEDSAQLTLLCLVFLTASRWG